MASTGTYAYLYDEKGKTMRRVIFSFNTDDTDENCYQDDLVIVDVGPE